MQKHSNIPCNKNLVARDTTVCAIRDWAEEINSPLALRVCMTLDLIFTPSSNAEGLQLLDELTVRPEHYDTYHAFARDYQLVHFVKSVPFYPGAELQERKLAALKKFYKRESANAEASQHFEALMKTNWFRRLFKRAQLEARRITGKWRDNKVVLRHGTGSAVGARGDKCHPVLRMTMSVSTLDNIDFFMRHSTKAERYQVDAHVKTATSIVRGALMEFVPKEALEERIIGIEPVENVQTQCALGDLLTTRAKRAGIHIKSNRPTNPVDDIFYQLENRKPDLLSSEVNQALALDGSRTGDFASIDVKNSSSSIFAYLIHELFALCDYGWREALEMTRSKYLGIPKDIYEYALSQGVFPTYATAEYDSSDKVYYLPLQMHSMMGNGFIFPLQTIMYHCLAHAVLPQGVLHSHFGDDAIVENKYARSFIVFLRALGFEVNAKKTFISGCFRESCGCDAYNGHVILKTKAKTYDRVELDDYLVNLHNALYRIWGGTSEEGPVFGTRILEYIRRQTRKHGIYKRSWQAITPEYGDCGFHSPRHLVKRRHRNGISWVRVFMSKVLHDTPFGKDRELRAKPYVLIKSYGKRKAVHLNQDMCLAYIVHTGSTRIQCRASERMRRHSRVSFT